MAKIVGYGIVGPNEPYLAETLKEFARLCDDVILCFNNPTMAERDLVESFGFKHVEDVREWGVNQWRIKEDFVTKHVAMLRPDMCVCLDMDEVFDKSVTKESLLKLYETPFEAFYFRIINLWDDGYAPDRSFWNIRAWKWNDEYGTRWPRKALHCGLGPDWTWTRGFYAPHLLIHSGLKDKERRELKAKRYDKYDPNAKFMSKDYYDALRKETHILPFDENKILEEVVQYVHDIKQKYVNPSMQTQDLIQIKIPNGEIVTVPRSKKADYLKRPGHEFVGDYKIVVDKLDALLEEMPDDKPAEVAEVGPEAPPTEGKKIWSWQK